MSCPYRVLHATENCYIQQDLVKSEQEIKIAELKANARVKESTGEAQAL
jgi:uncharacterized membrane protein YqiK